MSSFLAVGLGGALGAMGRYGISLLPLKSAFPWLTLLTNVLGALVIGFVVGVTADNTASPNTVLFWKTGVCGGFTRPCAFLRAARRPPACCTRARALCCASRVCGSGKCWAARCCAAAADATG